MRYGYFPVSIEGYIMSKNKPVFVYTENQSNLRGINTRMSGLKIQISANHPDIDGHKAELERMQMAWQDVRSKMTQDEFDVMHTHENRVLSVAERAAEAKATLDRMSQNKDSVSI